MKTFYNSSPPAEVPLNSLMAELIEEHLRFHVLSPAAVTEASQLEAADELIAVVKRYLR